MQEQKRIQDERNKRMDKVEKEQAEKRKLDEARREYQERVKA